MQWLICLSEEPNGCLRIYREDVEGVEQGTLLEFIPENSDLPRDMVLEFANEIVKLWNKKVEMEIAMNKSRFVKCCSCSIPIEINKDGFIIDGGEINVSFGYGSTLDGDTLKGFICDKCAGNLKDVDKKSEF